MSMSLPKDSAGTNDYAGKPKCARCRHHGIIVPKKGHTKICPFLKCQCWKCYLITERTKIAALQREMKRAMKETRPGARRVNAQGDKAFGTSNPDGGAPSTSEPMCPPPGGSPEKGAPAYPWSRPEAGGQPESGFRDSRDVLPSAGDSPFFSEFRQMARLPLVHFPVSMPGYHASSYPSPPHQFLPKMWLPPVHVGYLYPPPLQPGPPAACRGAFFTHQSLPEPFKEELMSRQHPPPPAPRATEQEAAQQVDEGNES
ncbi:doublesex- and mab-3-related transcription factor B1 [Haplochromis burtoni]|uniref:doublesex- and mab-3-related transcription factor B1 n=1 Tax=Haplochromis burtoni TaxID=8153 RepID=UPI0003BDB08A|nr:doublesex- and mab-3-related transcription factor B1 [Haplochromis burtoni]